MCAHLLKCTNFGDDSCQSIKPNRLQSCFLSLSFFEYTFAHHLYSYSHSLYVILSSLILRSDKYVQIKGVFVWID